MPATAKVLDIPALTEWLFYRPLVQDAMKEMDRRSQAAQYWSDQLSRLEILRSHRAAWSTVSWIADAGNHRHWVDTRAGLFAAMKSLDAHRRKLERIIDWYLKDAGITSEVR
jgi:hypothetical protein